MTWNADDAAQALREELRTHVTLERVGDVLNYKDTLARHLQAAHDAARTPWTTSDRLAAEAWADWNNRAPDSRETLHTWLARWLQVARDAALTSVPHHESTTHDPQTAPAPQPQPAQPHDPPLTAR